MASDRASYVTSSPSLPGFGTRDHLGITDALFNYYLCPSPLQTLTTSQLLDCLDSLSLEVDRLELHEAPLLFHQILDRGLLLLMRSAVASARQGLVLCSPESLTFLLDSCLDSLFAEESLGAFKFLCA